MDDVLPKPFTRKSLLDMLEKHLMHLKKATVDMDPAVSSAIAPPIPQSSASQSVRDDSSPGQSPAGSIGTWTSPGHFPGVSPLHTNIHSQYVPGQHHSPYIDQGPSPSSSFHSPQGPMNVTRPGPQVPSQPHRRPISDMACVTEADNYNKRPRMNIQPMAAPATARTQ